MIQGQAVALAMAAAAIALLLTARLSDKTGWRRVCAVVWGAAAVAAKLVAAGAIQVVWWCRPTVIVRAVRTETR